MLLKWTDRFTRKFVAFAFVLALAMGNSPSSTLAIEPPADALRTIELDIEVWEMTLSEEDMRSDFVKLNLSEQVGGYLMRRLLLGNLQIPPATETPRQRPPTRSSSKLSIDKETCVRVDRMFDEPTASLQIKVKPSLVGSDEINLDYSIVRNSKRGEVKLTAKRDVKFGSILTQFIKPCHVDGEAIPEVNWLVLMSPRQQNVDGTTSFNRVDIRQEMNPQGTQFLPRSGRFEIQISEGWSGLLMANSMDSSFIRLTGSTNVGKSKDARASDNHVRLEAFQAERPVMEVVYTDDGFIEVVARRPGVASMRYDVIGLDGKTAICELQIVVAADTTEIDRTIKDILPNAHIKVTNVKDAALLTGFVAKKDDLLLLVKIAKQFYPSVINRVKVGTDSNPTENNSMVPIVDNPVRQTFATNQRTTVGEPSRVPTPTEFQPDRASRRSSAELKALQRDVRALRDDVRRLSDLLEKRSASGQFPRPAKPADHDQSTPLPVETQHTEIQAALLKPISLEFIDTPLRDVMRKIKELLDVNLVIDSQSLSEAGLEETHRVSIVISGVSARSALKLILEPLQLTFIENDEVLKIVNSERAKGELTTVIYPVDDLIQSLSVDDAAPTSVNAKSSADHIINGMTGIRDLIKKTISPQSWEDVGGRGSVKSLTSPYILVIRQTVDAHAEVDELLQQVRRLHRLPKRASIPLHPGDVQDVTLVAKTYAVADLIIPLPDGPGSRTKVITSDWLKLIDLIIRDVEPKKWALNGGPCSIHAFGSTMSLIVHATPNMHEAITTLLRGMRREQDLQVSVAFNFLKITDNEILYKAGIKFEFDPDTGMSRLDEPDGKKLIAAVQSGNGASSHSAPKFTIFNGGIARIGPDLQSPSGVPLGYELHVRGNVSEDRRSVRLSVALNPESLVNDLINNSHRLEDGGYLLLDITDGPPIQKRSSNPHGSIDLTRDSNRHPAPIPSKRRLVSNLVLIQPRIIIPEEEEEQLAAPIRDVERK